jgi:large subunit ribosomal protein L9
MSIKVILTRDVPEVGRAGTVLNVAPGYARNYLYPRGLALEASDGNLRQLQLKRKRAEELAALEKAEAHKTAQTLSTVELHYKLKAGEGGQLFGSVAPTDIAESLREKGVEIDRRKVLLREHIKKTGVHLVDIRLHGDVLGRVRVIVEAEAPPPSEKKEKQAKEAAEAEPAATEETGEAEPAAAEEAS